MGFFVCQNCAWNMQLFSTSPLMLSTCAAQHDGWDCWREWLSSCPVRCGGGHWWGEGLSLAEIGKHMWTDETAVTLRSYNVDTAFHAGGMMGFAVCRLALFILFLLK